jgi:hypothetical protein
VLTHSQVRDLNSDQPSRSSARNEEAITAGRAGHRGQQTGEHRTRDGCRRTRYAEQGVAVGQRVRAHDVRNEGAQSGGEQGLRRAPDGDKCDQRPQARIATEQDHGKAELSDAAHRVGRQHHLAAAQTVADHPAGEQHENQRQDPGRQNPAQLCASTAALQDGEGQRDRGHRGSEQGGGVADEETAEVALTQHREAAVKGHGRRVQEPGGDTPGPRRKNLSRVKSIYDG